MPTSNAQSKEELEKDQSEISGSREGSDGGPFSCGLGRRVGTHEATRGTMTTVLCLRNETSLRRED